MIEVYTDGSSSLKQKKGGSGVYIEFQDSKIMPLEISVPFLNILTGQAEICGQIFALLKLLQAGYENEEIILFSDSKYVCNSINIWIYSWIKTKFIGKANVELIKYLFYLKCQFNNLTIKHIKGHDGNYGNEIADKLATSWNNLTDESDFLNISDFIDSVKIEIENKNIDNFLEKHC